MVPLVHHLPIQAIDSSLVVHCSAGIGRSGTFCCVHTVARHLREKGDEVVTPQEKEAYERLLIDTVLRLRKQRPGMVQTRVLYPVVKSLPDSRSNIIFVI